MDEDTRNLYTSHIFNITFKICYKQFINNMSKYLFEIYSEKNNQEPIPPHDSFD